jgi:hypothetical protein
MEKSSVWKWRRSKVIGNIQLEYAAGEISRTFRMSFEICILRAARLKHSVQRKVLWQQSI